MSEAQAEGPLFWSLLNMNFGSQASSRSLDLLLRDASAEAIEEVRYQLVGFIFVGIGDAKQRSQAKFALRFVEGEIDRRRGYS